MSDYNINNYPRDNGYYIPYEDTSAMKVFLKNTFDTIFAVAATRGGAAAGQGAVAGATAGGFRAGKLIDDTARIGGAIGTSATRSTLTAAKSAATKASNEAKKLEDAAAAITGKSKAAKEARAQADEAAKTARAQADELKSKVTTLEETPTSSPQTSSNLDLVGLAEKSTSWKALPGKLANAILNPKVGQSLRVSGKEAAATMKEWKKLDNKDTLLELKKSSGGQYIMGFKSKDKIKGNLALGAQGLIGVGAVGNTVIFIAEDGSEISENDFYKTLDTKDQHEITFGPNGLLADAVAQGDVETVIGIKKQIADDDVFWFAGFGDEKNNLVTGMVNGEIALRDTIKNYETQTGQKYVPKTAEATEIDDASFNNIIKNYSRAKQDGTIEFFDNDADRLMSADTGNALLDFGFQSLGMFFAIPNKIHEFFGWRKSIDEEQQTVKEALFETVYNSGKDFVIMTNTDGTSYAVPTGEYATIALDAIESGQIKFDFNNRDNNKTNIDVFARQFFTEEKIKEVSGVQITESNLQSFTSLNEISRYVSPSDWNNIQFDKDKGTVKALQDIAGYKAGQTILSIDTDPVGYGQLVQYNEEIKAGTTSTDIWDNFIDPTKRALEDEAIDAATKLAKENYLTQMKDWFWKNNINQFDAVALETEAEKLAQTGYTEEGLLSWTMSQIPKYEAHFASSFPMFEDKLKSGLTARDLLSPQLELLSTVYGVGMDEIGLNDKIMESVYKTDEKGNTTVRDIWQLQKELWNRDDFYKTDYAAQRMASLAGAVTRRMGI
jgi:hypothetical protein